MKKMKLVLVGNGMAGVRTIEELLKLAPDLYDITVFGAEPHGNYNRILLSPVLAGEMTLPEIMLNDLDWYRDNGITLHAGRQVTKIDRVKRKVIAEAADGSGGHFLWLRFQRLGDGLEMAMERHLFRLHRRQVAEARRAR